MSEVSNYVFCGAMLEAWVLRKRPWGMRFAYHHGGEFGVLDDACKLVCRNRKSRARLRLI